MAQPATPGWVLSILSTSKQKKYRRWNRQGKRQRGKRTGVRDRRGGQTKVCVVWSWTITRSVKNKNETTRQNSRHIASRHIHTHTLTQGTRTPDKASTVQGREEEKNQHGTGGRSISRRLLGHMHNNLHTRGHGPRCARHAHLHTYTPARTQAHLHTPTRMQWAQGASA